MVTFGPNEATSTYPITPIKGRPDSPQTWSNKQLQEKQENMAVWLHTTRCNTLWRNAAWRDAMEEQLSAGLLIKYIVL